ncbi:SAM-dependent methyltransferase [Fulvivirgaceae bacterium PWU4]|uniref:SAM-dependent methyltransferase n=1 Tax=Chryseosolibacter histidini TaxID=2782349 RepID=A0AAP2DPA1_9BACT|nr:class I SAM-dependent methyltransferase [Chryseosolibacter histidini]MBT1700010.1 SAM-dependent methyltransferase [Chryseosolibacter histidini]
MENQAKAIIESLFSEQVQNYIITHEHDDERDLVLRHKEILGVPSAVIAEQIAGRRKAKEKLPLYYQTPGIVYPPAINLEQTSSEQTARFKSSLITEALAAHGDKPLARAIDLTSGLGIDTYFLSRIFTHFDAVEPNPGLLETAQHNHQQLGATNIRHHNTTAETFLAQLNEKVNLVFIDPSRRTSNKKVFTLTDSEPDIVSLQHTIFEKTDNLLVKASPLLDISLALKALDFVKSVYVVAVDNEVKELLFLAEKDFNGEPLIHSVNLLKQRHDSFSFSLTDEATTIAKFSDPLVYLYEPNAAILKAGAFKTIAQRFKLAKIQSSTHLYTADLLAEDFPGRIFLIEARVKPDAKSLKPFFPEGKANITTRNYPLTVEELKKKTGLKDGGEKFLIGFSGVIEKFLVAARRVK